MYTGDEVTPVITKSIITSNYHQIWLNEPDCIKHCLGVYEQSNIVN